MANTSVGASLDQRTLSLQYQVARNPQSPEGGPAAAAAGTGNSTEAARIQLNLQILRSSTEVSIQAGNQSQSLVFRTAIERINESLTIDLGPDAIQGKASDDTSPEATAGRILSLSTGFFDAYAAQHSGEDPDQVAKNFVDLIRSGFEKGFNEAKDILQSLQALSGDVESGIQKTFDLVSKGFDDFLAGKLTPKAEGAKTAA